MQSIKKYLKISKQHINNKHRIFFKEFIKYLIMKIILTGGTGFIGSNFLNHAIPKKHQILAIRKNPKSKTRIPLIEEPIWLDKEIDEVNVNELEGYDCLIHLAAHSANTPYDSIENCLEFNLIKSFAFLKKAYKAGVSKFIIAGSCFEYGKKGEESEFIPPDAALFPTQSYPASKAAASIIFTQWAIENSIDMTILRIFQVFGKGESKNRFWPSIKETAKSGKDFEMTKGEQVDFINVEIVAKQILEEALNINQLISIKNIGSGDPQTLAKFATRFGKKIRVRVNNFSAKEYRKRKFIDMCLI